MNTECDQTRVLMDGKPLHGVHAFRIECSKGGITRITLELSGTADIDGQAQVWVNGSDPPPQSPPAEPKPAAAEARPDGVDPKPLIDPATGTLAYIVPVPKNEGFRTP